MQSRRRPRMRTTRPQNTSKSASAGRHGPWCYTGRTLERRPLTEAAMRTFLGTVLSVIAAGVLLIAYGLLSPRAAAAPYGLVTPDSRADAYQLARPMPVNDIISLNDQAAYERYLASRRALAAPAYPVAVSD